MLSAPAATQVAQAASSRSSSTVAGRVRANRCDQLVFGLRPGGDEPAGVGVEPLPAADDLGPGGGVGRVADVDGQAEAVEELGSEVALLRVHGADEEEPGRVAVGDAIPLHPVHARGGGVEQGIDQVVGQEVDLVHVEDAPVGRGQQPGLEPDITAGQRRPQVERAHHPLLGRAQGELDERTPVEEGGQAPGERGLGRPLVSPEEHPADVPVGRGQDQGQLGLLRPDHGRQWELVTIGRVLAP